MVMSGDEIIDRSAELRRKFSSRDRNFSNWFDLLDQVDEYAQEGMESFVGNDPRTLWNMSNFLLQPRPLTVTIRRIDEGRLTVEEQAAANIVQRRLGREWIKRDKLRMRIGGAGCKKTTYNILKEFLPE